MVPGAKTVPGRDAGVVAGGEILVRRGSDISAVWGVIPALRCWWSPAAALSRSGTVKGAVRQWRGGTGRVWAAAIINLPKIFAIHMFTARSRMAAPGRYLPLGKEAERICGYWGAGFRQ